MNNTHETTVTLETLKRAEKYINNDYPAMLHMMHVIANIVEEIPAVRRRKRK